MVPKTIITGTGRAGTSFLMLILTKLGYNTELTFDKYCSQVRAGMEYEISILNMSQKEFVEEAEKWPDILKSPEWVKYLKLWNMAGLPINHVIIPVRDMLEVANSRLNVGLDWNFAQDNRKLTLEEQFAINCQMLGIVVETCITCNMPFTLMKFPNLVQDSKYCFDKLKSAFPELEYNSFKEAFDDISLFVKNK